MNQTLKKAKTRNEKIRQALTAELLKLGNTPDAVANALLKAGKQGSKEDGGRVLYHPLTYYVESLMQKAHSHDVRISSPSLRDGGWDETKPYGVLVWGSSSQATYIEVELNQVLQAFCKELDEGKYPFLWMERSAFMEKAMKEIDAQYERDMKRINS